MKIKIEDLKLLENLCRVDGISGFEDNVREVMVSELKKSCETVEVDSFGNVTGKKGKGKLKIMLAAHMDEIGLMVKHINKEGYLSFVKIGGIDDRILLGKEVIIKSRSGDVYGVIGAKPPHLQEKEEMEKIVKSEEMFIDIGAKNEKEAKKRVSVGDPIVFSALFGRMSDELFYGKAVDDRLGCYVLLKVMEKIPKNIEAEVYAVGTTQEEVGLKGARVSAFKINPNYAFAIDTTLAGDTPQIKETESSLKLGKGPSITITESCGRGVITHPKLRALLERIAKKYRIPYQEDLLEGGMTDGAIIYLTREGIPTGVVSIPCRYIHSSTGVFNIKDVNNAIELLTKTILEFKI
ncbi:MAG: M42 family metallopeptidase [Candidatus Altiarchaeota archaeon]